MPATELMGLDRVEMATLLQRFGERPFRSRQLAEAVYRQRVASVDDISTFPLPLRAQMADAGITVGLPRIEKLFSSQDGTIRYLIGLSDGQTVESVWMPHGDGGENGEGTEAGDDDANPVRNRATICVSSQVGCAVDCQFCLTALLGVKRNLSAGEIVGQICAILRERNVSPPQDRVNIVFMGMGEPFLNYDNFMNAVHLLVSEVGIAESRMTVSTAGIVPRIEDFGREKVRPRLAISLNASNDESRSALMPINRKWNLEKLIGAAREFPLRTREKVTFEYVLLGGVNDQLQNAHEVVRLLQGIRARVNLIALNPGPGIAFSTPDEERVLAFQRVLREAGIPTFVRRPRGRDIFAACGQLKRTVEIATSPAQ